MKILKKSKEFTMAELYRLTKSPEIAKMATVKGQEMEIANFIVREEINNDDETILVTAVETVQGELLATNSPTFNRDFIDILEMCEEAGEAYPRTVKVLAKESKSGRIYLQCAYIN